MALFCIFGYRGASAQDLTISPALSSVTEPLPVNFSLTVRVENSADSIDAASMRITFDPALVQVVTVTPLSGFFNIVKPVLDNVAGTLVYDVGIFSNFPSGSFSLASVDFRAIAPGQTTIALSGGGTPGSVLASAGGQVLQNTTGAVVTIGGGLPDCTVDANADATPKKLDCNTGSVSLSGQTSTGTYRWTGPNGYTSSAQNPSVTTAGVYTLSSPAPDCSASSNVTVLAAAGTQTYYADNDGDGLGDPDNPRTDCTLPPGYVTNDLDCDDTDSTIGKESTYYLDSDGDGYGDDASTVIACSAPNGHVARGGDCDDSKEEIYPGAPELCDALDNDCNGQVDDGANCTAQSTFWLEAECATVGSNFNVVASPAASNGEYVVFSDGRELYNAPPDVPANRVRFNLDNAEAGNYTLFARVNAPTSNDDSFWVRINNGTWIKWNEQFTLNAGFTWNAYTLSPVNLASGANTIDFAYREDGTQLDKLYLTKSGTPPAGTGGTATNCDNPPANEPPVAKATANQTTGTAPLDVQFGSAGSFDPDGTIVGYEWAWDGGSATTAAPSATFPAGSYAVSLTVTDDEGAKATNVINITATAPPGTARSNFWLEAECATVGSNFNVVASPAASGGEYIVFSNGRELYNAPPDVPANRVRFSLTEVEAGNYALFARVNAPTSDDDSFWVRVNDGVWYKWNGEFALNAGFNWTAYSASQVSLASGANTIDFAYREDGTQLDKLYLTKSSTPPAGTGGTATNCDNPPANLPPLAKATATPTTGTAPLNVQFSSAGSSDADGSIVAYEWTWNGGSATTAAPAATFPTGSYAVTLTVTDDRGAKASDVINITATAPPGTARSNFWLEAECATVGSNFNVVASPAASGGEYVVFSNGRELYNAPPDVPANRVRFSLTEVEAGNYVLFARVNAPTSDDDSFWVRVNGGAWYKWNGEFPLNAGFNWAAYSGPQLSLASGANTVDFAYREDGTQLDKLYLTKTGTAPTGTGGTATNCSQPPANQSPLAKATATPTTGTAPLDVQFSSAGSSDPDGRIVAYEWTWDGGSATTAAPAATFPTGSYAVTLTVTDDRGAKATDVITVTATAPPSTARSTFWLEAECATIGSNFNVLSSPAASGGKYAVFSNGRELDNAPPDVPANRVRFSITDVEAGNYALFARVNAPNSGDDSFWVRINDGAWYKWNGEFPLNNGFNWTAYSGPQVTLASGANTVDFAYREDGTQLDKLYLSKSATAPTGTGGTATNCVTNSRGLEAQKLLSKALPVAAPEINLFPNPATDRLNFTLFSDFRGAVELMLIDGTGRNVSSLRRDKTGDELRHSLQIGSLPSGVYRLRVIEGDRQTIKPFVKM